MKDYMKSVLIGILIIAVLVGAAFALGIVDLKFTEFFGTKKANVQREIFEENKSYIKGMAKDLAKCKRELETTKDETEKKAIVNYILETFADFDEEKLESDSLKRFLKNVRNGNY